MPSLRSRLDRLKASAPASSVGRVAEARAAIQGLPLDELRARYAALTDGPARDPTLDGLGPQALADRYRALLT